MTTLIVDIETASLWDQLSEAQRAHLTALYNKNPAIHGPDETPESRAPLDPQTGKIIVIGVKDVERNRATAFYEAPPGGALTPHVEGTGGRTFVPCVDEAAVLEHYWRAVAKAGRVVTFNGWRFDMPFVYRRSLVRRVKPSRELHSKWYERQKCLDLREELSVLGRFTQYNLEFTCDEFGVPSPKRLMTGRGVQSFYEAGEIAKIAAYCLDDCDSTGALFEMLAPVLLPNWAGHRA